MDALLTTLSVLLIGAGLGMLSYALKHFRFHQGRLQQPIDESWTPRATLFVPCKGLEAGLSEHLQAMFEQRYPNYELCFVVESEADPALSVISALREKNPHVASRVVVAGIAGNCGQKVFNLMQATRTVSETTEVLAFADSDAKPHATWLWRLVDQLRDPENGVVTGYRWFAPVAPTLLNLLLSCLNTQILGMLGPTPHNLVWGGAFAIRKETFALVGLPGAWEGCLTDDLPVNQAVRAANLRVAYEPHCVTISQADASWQGLCEFWRRQYLIVRVYSPQWFRSAFLGGLLLHGALCAMIVWSALAMATGGQWIIPTMVAATYYGILSVRNWEFNTAIRPFLKANDRQIRQVALMSIALAPVIMVFNWLLMSSSLLGRTIVWRGIGYRLDSYAKTTVLFRPATPASAPASQKAA